MEDQKNITNVTKETPSLTEEQVVNSIHVEKQANSMKKLPNRKGCLIFVVCFFVAIIALVLGLTLGLGDVDDSIKLTKEEKTIKEICVTTDEQAIAINQILNDCGIDEIQSIEHDEMLDGWDNEGDTGYRLKSQDINNIILYLNKNKEVYIIRHADIPIYSG